MTFLNDEFAKEKLLGPAIAYQLTLSKWGSAAVCAGLESLLDNDPGLEPEQRFALRAMTTDLRKMLGEDTITIEQESEEDEVTEDDPPAWQDDEDTPLAEVYDLAALHERLNVKDDA